MKTETLTKTDLRNIEVKIDQLSELIQTTLTVLIEKKDTTGVIQNTIKERLNEDRKEVFNIPVDMLRQMQYILENKMSDLNNWQIEFFENMLTYKKASAKQLAKIEENVNRF